MPISTRSTSRPICVFSRQRATAHPAGNGELLVGLRQPSGDVLADFVRRDRRNTRRMVRKLRSGSRRASSSTAARSGRALACRNLPASYFCTSSVPPATISSNTRSTPMAGTIAKPRPAGDRSLSSTHDANAWPADRYAGLPAPTRGEQVVLWIQNSHPVPIPAGAIGLNRMGRDRVAPLCEPLGALRHARRRCRRAAARFCLAGPVRAARRQTHGAAAL